MGSVADQVRRSLVIVQGHHHGTGAGVIWRENGIILTNNHVVNSRAPRVTLPDGSQYRGAVLARDPQIDLALLQIDAGGLTPVRVADSRRLRVGQWVLAVGHPWGQPGYVTGGVISALLRAQTQPGGREIPVIRTDAALAPGNSGGPLVDASGAVIGINTLIVGGDQSFAIPSHLAEVLAEQVLPKEARPPEETEYEIAGQVV
jgi:S1-C subfamily serine protease